MKRMGRSFAWRVAVAMLGIVSTACAHAGDTSILGDWTIVKGIVAPWVGPSVDTAPYVADAKAHLQMSVTFEPTRIIAKDHIIGCTEVSYERTLMPPRGLFQGGLPEPNQTEIARSLGFAKGDIPGFDVVCSTGLFSYHFANGSTLLFALDNVIYTLERDKDQN